MATLLNISSVFSRNMEDIVVAFDGESSLSIGVSCANSENIDFTLCAIDKQVSIHASDIVSNYARAYEPHIESIDSHSESMDEIQIELKAEALRHSLAATAHCTSRMKQIFCNTTF